jgi:hypothetical protein
MAVGCVGRWSGLDTESRQRRMGADSHATRAVITGTGHYVPDCVVTNEDLSRRLRGDLTPGAIERLTGIK